MDLGTFWKSDFVQFGRLVEIGNRRNSKTSLEVGKRFCRIWKLAEFKNELQKDFVEFGKSAEFKNELKKDFVEMKFENGFTK